MQRDYYCAKQTLIRGGIILYPTDTIWGIGCDATNPQAVERLNRIKQRQPGQPLLVLVDSVEMLQQYVEKVPDFIYDKLNEFDVPTTVIFPKARNLPENLIAADGSIGIRLVKHPPFPFLLINIFGKPLVSTSANFSGMPAPRSFEDIDTALKEKVDYIVPERYAVRSSGQASVILKIEGRELIKIR